MSRLIIFTVAPRPSTSTSTSTSSVLEVTVFSFPPAVEKQGDADGCGDDEHGGDNRNKK